MYLLAAAVLRHGRVNIKMGCAFKDPPVHCTAVHLFGAQFTLSVHILYIKLQYNVNRNNHTWPTAVHAQWEYEDGASILLKALAALQ